MNHRYTRMNTDLFTCWFCGIKKSDGCENKQVVLKKERAKRAPIERDPRSPNRKVKIRVYPCSSVATNKTRPAGLE